MCKVKKNIITRFANKIGMDGAIAFSSAARIIQAFSGVVSIFFIATFLTGDEQGFFYTFGSLLAIQVFFELGFTGIMTQYVAHEVVHLKLNDSQYYEGESKYKSRLAYLVKFCIKWYAIISALFLLVIIIVGFIYFNKFDNTGGIVVWKGPWILLAFSTAIKLFQSPFTAIYLGLGKVKEMNEVIFYQQIAIPISQWVLFACGIKLYVVGISSLIGVIVWCVYALKKNLWGIFVGLFKEKITDTVSYMKEIFPYQWKIALSWISGYFIFQLFNPVLFATKGAVVAGQMGMTVSVLSSIQAFAFSWQNTKIPLYSGFIALRKFDELDNVFNKTMRQMMGVWMALISVLYFGIWFLDETKLKIGNSILADRFLEFLPLTLMVIPMIINQYVSSWATYLRCHKQEPFLVNSIVIGTLCCISTFLFGRLFGLYGITIGYCCITAFVALPWSYLIFIKKKAEWHYDK